jgi:glycine/D-amino acid oxidase-like deaminating enzyme
LSPAEIAERMPGNVDAWIGGLHTPSDGRAEPSMAVPALAAAARKHGVTIHQGCAARGLETQSGRVSAVVTERGTIRAQSVLLAGGAWSSLFCRRHGIELPIGIVNATACRTTPAPKSRWVLSHSPPPRWRLHAGAAQPRQGGVVAGSVSLCPDLLADLQAPPEGALESRSSISSCEVRTGVSTNLHRSRPRACAIPRQTCRSSAGR